MSIFGAAHGWRVGSQKGHPHSLKSVTYILQLWIISVKSYLKWIQNIYGSRDTTREFCWHPFTGNQQIISRNTDTDFILIDTF